MLPASSGIITTLHSVRPDPEVRPLSSSLEFGNWARPR
ncbi:rCG29461 [Rattus norvegicus]|uniref:RCG29461 n=1 Tax=Rattus norvegicus TaxID=10116 RepID=A6K974_RAT|nr:rCG29461 [Rattus norvegicus]